MQQRDNQPARTRSIRSASWLGLFGALALTASCNGTSSDGAGSGGATTSGGATASGGAASGGAASGGSNSDLGGNAGSAGAPALPACGCSDQGSITVESPEGTRVYDRIAVHGDGCNPLTCEPEAAYAVWRGAPPSRYAMRACHADGECVQVQTGPFENPSIDGSITLETDGEVTLDEPATVEATRALDVLTLEFTFETISTEVSIHGSGSLCWAETEYLCLK